MRLLASTIASLALLGLPLASHAVGVTDSQGDFLATFAGSHARTDLDVVSANVFYNPGTDLFTLTATMDGNIASTAAGLYVWGVNRGAGTAGFSNIGATGVLFDRVVILRPNGTGTVNGAGGGALPTGAVTISGKTITAVVSGSMLQSTGFASKLDYTWNLWPRDSSVVVPAGTTTAIAISDFAPDNSNFTATAVPEPASAALLLGGLGLVAVYRRRQSNS